MAHRNFLHFILSLKVINKIPFLNDYLTITKAFDKEKYRCRIKQERQWKSELRELHAKTAIQ